MIALLLILAVVLFIIFRPKYREPQIIRGVLTDEECEYIKSKALKKLKPSMIGTGKIHDTTYRDSESAGLRLDRDPKLREMMERCTDDISRCERLQVIRYKPGGFYNPHSDAFPSDTNHRVHTFIFALNDEYEGGETYFPILDMSYRLKKGDVLSFDTLNTWGYIPEEAIHGGATVKSGEKWIANLWLRQTSIA